MEINSIQRFSFARLSNANAVSVYGRMIEAVKPASMPELSAHKPRFERDAEHFIEISRQPVASAESRFMIVRDRLRDRRIVSLRNCVSQGMSNPNEEIARAANIVDVAIRAYDAQSSRGDITKLQFDEQTTAVRKLIRDLNEPSMKANVEKVPTCAAIVAEVDLENEEFAREFDTRLEQRSGITKGETERLRRIADASATNLVEVINAYERINPNGVLVPVIHAINNILNEAREGLSIRKRGRTVRNNNENNNTDTGENQNPS